MILDPSDPNSVDCFNCAQAIFSAYCQDYGIDKIAALKASCGFGAGMGCMAGACGAVTGAYIVIGLKYGRSDILDLSAKEKTYKLVREFSEKFKSRNGSTVCKDLLGVDISTTEGMKAAQQRNIHGTCCRKFVKDAAEIIEEML